MRTILAVIYLIFSTLFLALSPATVTSFLYDFTIFETPAASDKTFCTRVVDGDTIVIGAGTYVRLIGVDTPESVHPRSISKRKPWNSQGSIWRAKRFI